MVSASIRNGHDHRRTRAQRQVAAAGGDSLVVQTDPLTLAGPAMFVFRGELPAD